VIAALEDLDLGVGDGCAQEPLVFQRREA
jgi:hypothetical protein